MMGVRIVATAAGTNNETSGWRDADYLRASWLLLLAERRIPGGTAAAEQVQLEWTLPLGLLCLRGPTEGAWLA